MNLNTFFVKLKFCAFFFANLGGMHEEKYDGVYKFVRKYTSLEIEDIKSFFEDSSTLTGPAVAVGAQEEDIFLVKRNLPSKSSPMPDQIKMYYQNVQSIKSEKKMENFDNSLVAKYDIILFTETWLTKKQDIFTGNMKTFNSDFSVYRRDRSEKVLKDRGGGVMIAISSKFHSDIVRLGKKYNHLEYVCAKIEEEGKMSIFLYCAYIPPNSSLGIYEDHFNAIGIVKSEKMKKEDILIVIGDFNLKIIKWEKKNDQTMELNYNGPKLSVLCDKKIIFNIQKKYKMSYELDQLCEHKNQSGNILDLVYSNKKGCIVSINELTKNSEHMSIKNEDHVTLDITVDLQQKN